MRETRDRRRPANGTGAARAVAASGAGLLLLAALYLWSLGASAPPEPAPVGGPFDLVSGSGRTVTERSFPGRYQLIFFGYTACPDACPLALDSVADAMRRLGPRADRVQPLFITLDPARDTPDVVRRYAASFTPRLVGLTGTPDRIRAVAARYGIETVRHRPPARGGAGDIDHSAVLFLMAPDGRLSTSIAADATGAEIAAALDRSLDGARDPAGQGGSSRSTGTANR